MHIQNKEQMTILVTGTNRGLGKDLAKLLLNSKSNLRLIFTARNLNQDVKNLQQQWRQTYPQSKFIFKSLDLSSCESIDKFSQQIKNQNIKLDVLANNAALGADFGQKVPDKQYSKSIMYTNVIGTIKLTQNILPFLNNNGRIVNVSSKLGGLMYQKQQVQNQFNDPTLEQQQIYTAVEQYIALCETGDLGKWSNSAYGTSKMFLNSWSRFILKRKLQANQISICMSPGHCQTDMGGNNAPNSSQSGAQAIFDCIFMQNPSFDVFMHRGKASDYYNCGF